MFHSDVPYFFHGVPNFFQEAPSIGQLEQEKTQSPLISVESTKKNYFEFEILHLIRPILSFILSNIWTVNLALCCDSI